jgi:hypothetical protein
MTETNKKKLLIFVGFVALATAFVAASLSQMQLKPGLPLPSVEGGKLVASSIETVPTAQITISAFFRIVLVVFVAALALGIAIRLLKDLRRNKIRWSQLISAALTAVVILLVITGILALLVSLLPATKDLPSAAQLGAPAPAATAPLGPPPPLLKWLVLIGLAILVATGGMLIFKLSTQARLRRSSLEREAEKARQAILAGASLKDVVLRCYQQMSLALQEEQGIAREGYMTSGEFESLLAGKGFPYEPVHQLTRLFESVRYGRWQPNKNDEQTALDCLAAILQHSRERGRPRN